MIPVIVGYDQLKLKCSSCPTLFPNLPQRLSNLQLVKWKITGQPNLKGIERKKRSKSTCCKNKKDTLFDFSDFVSKASNEIWEIDNTVIKLIEYKLKQNYCSVVL